MSSTTVEKEMTVASKPKVAVLETSALQAASPIVLALAECDDELRKEAVELFKQLSSGELTSEEIFATTALLAEILFPNADHDGIPGLDLVEAEKQAPQVNAEAHGVLAQMDEEESIFAARLKACMADKSMTQAELAQKIGVGQPAISMMLQRCCRPQKRTVIRLAEALGVSPKDLWPNLIE